MENATFVCRLKLSRTIGAFLRRSVFDGVVASDPRGLFV